MKHMLTSMMLATALLLCFDGRALWLPLAAADEEAPANATVSFGAWQTEPPFDRFPPNNPNDRTRNDHQVLPNEALIQAGGAVNFVISGFHQPIVYDVGSHPEDIDVTNTTTTTGPKNSRCAAGLSGANASSTVVSRRPSGVRSKARK